MNIFRIFLYLILFTSTLIVPACDRLDMYDIANGKSRTAYAIAYDGVNYTLILANVYYIKSFKLASGLSTPSGISVNNKGEIILFTPSATISILNDLTTWTILTSQPTDTNVIGFNESFICFDLTNFYINQLLDNNVWTQTIGSFPTNSLGIFKGNNSEIFIVEPNATNVNLYSMNNPINPILTATIGVSLVNPFGGYKTKNYFYIWYNDIVNSIFRITQSTSITLNPTTAIGNSLIDLAVTDDDKVFAIVSDTGQYYLKQIISDNNYPTLLNLGSTGNFFIDSLDNNHLVITSSGADTNYNGVIIYNIDDNKIEKHVTTTNVIALYVLR